MKTKSRKSSDSCLKIQNIIQVHESSPLKDEDLYICIPDTRFKNEFDYIKTCRTDNFKLFMDNIIHSFVKVERIMPSSNEQYIDPGRDKNHPSECDLNDVIADYYIRANDGDLITLRNETLKFINNLTL